MSLPYTLVIGLEVHVQLNTVSKLFSGSANRFNPDAPNTQTDAVILGLPGALPVMNREAFRLAVKAACALDCEIAAFTKWDRKQYFYPDLPKGYQISQYDLPFSQNGALYVPLNEDSQEQVKIRINRVHLEEDAGKNLHDSKAGASMTQVDLNRAGTPLLEIVSEPDLRSGFQARKYLEELRLLMLYLDISDCNMQEGSLRCDANINLHIEQDDGEKIATPIVEIKNMNSFRNIELAIAHEEKRQFLEWQKTKNTIKDFPKQTRGWNVDRGETFVQREKEEASDYRYFPDPDLLPVTVTPEFIEQTKADSATFPRQRKSNYLSNYGLNEYDADVILDQGRSYADYFEYVAAQCGDGKQAANWLTQDVQRELNERKVSIEEFPVKRELLGAILQKITTKKITTKSARELFSLLLERDESDLTLALIDELIEKNGLAIVEDNAEIEELIKELISKNDKVVNSVKEGKLQAVGPIVGQVMKKIKGADPASVKDKAIELIQKMP